MALVCMGGMVLTAGLWCECVGGMVIVIGSVLWQDDGAGKMEGTEGSVTLVGKSLNSSPMT